mmetsp:Transcript_54730/g.118338  ORF Transcript_54730/g.118338 Transcript_54730/m.118338 type:complete len:298 (+) Transcript_54730:190-1083(+)
MSKRGLETTLGMRCTGVEGSILLARGCADVGSTWVARSGMRNVRVLPDPVTAESSTSSPLRMWGMASACNLLGRSTAKSFNLSISCFAGGVSKPISPQSFSDLSAQLTPPSTRCHGNGSILRMTALYILDSLGLAAFSSSSCRFLSCFVGGRGCWMSQSSTLLCFGFLLPSGVWATRTGSAGAALARSGASSSVSSSTMPPIFKRSARASPGAAGGKVPQPPSRLGSGRCWRCLLFTTTAGLLLSEEACHRVFRRGGFEPSSHFLVTRSSNSSKESCCNSPTGSNSLTAMRGRSRRS